MAIGRGEPGNRLPDPSRGSFPPCDPGIPPRDPKHPNLNLWRETPFYSEPERAALACAEALTLVHQTHAPDALRGGPQALHRGRGGSPSASARCPAPTSRRRRTGPDPYSWSAIRRTVTRRFFTSG